MKLACAHEIPLSAEAFWDVIHSPRYEALVAETIGLHEYSELERRDERDAIYRRIRSRPELPEALAALFRRIAPRGAAPSYVEEQWRAKEARVVRWRMEPSVLADRIRVEGVLRVEPIDDARCRRVLEGVVEVKLLGLGALVERAVVAATVDAYARSAALVARL